MWCFSDLRRYGFVTCPLDPSCMSIGCQINYKTASRSLEALVGGGGVLSHLGNAGRMIVSYSLLKAGIGQLSADRSSCYLLRPKGGANIPIQSTAAYTKDQIHLEKPPPGSTMYLEILLGEPYASKWI